VDKTGQRGWKALMEFLTFLLMKQSLTAAAYPLRLRVSTRVQREETENSLPLEAVPPCYTGLHVTKWFDHLYYDAPLVYSLDDVDNWRLKLCYAVLDGAL
jgi:hypothetical protein